MESDVLIIGGGFYGCELAKAFRASGKTVRVLEMESKLLQRASYVNQARVHNGYHYPRNYLTAYRSHKNFGRFAKDYAYAICDNFTKLYAVARHNSKVSPSQFFQFCKKIGSPIRDVSDRYDKIFDMSRIEAVFEVTEFAFDALALMRKLRKQLSEAGVHVKLNTEARRVLQGYNGLCVETTSGDIFQAEMVINCTYSRINHFLRSSNLPTLAFKHELIEMALLEPPKELKTFGITVMDGPFFSTMPFPAQNLHSLSHVHYTPIKSWADKSPNVRIDPYQKLAEYGRKTKASYMIKDASRYLPVLQKAVYKTSLYEIKTVLLENEDDDGRPILFRKDHGLKGFSVVMGGKIDNIYDILSALKRHGMI